MNRKYLLTYEKEINILGQNMYSIKTYEWFEDEEEMNDFIDDWNITPIEKLYVSTAEKLVD